MSFAFYLVLLAQAVGVRQDAGAQPTPPMPELHACRSAVSSTSVNTLSELPGDAQAELRRFFPEGFADAGFPFNPTDVVGGDTPPQRRFLRAYEQEGDWIIWYEHGGRGYHLHALGLRQRKSGRKVDGFARYTGNTAQHLCAATRAFFDGAMTSYDH